MGQRPDVKAHNARQKEEADKRRVFIYREYMRRTLEGKDNARTIMKAICEEVGCSVSGGWMNLAKHRAYLAEQRLEGSKEVLFEALGQSAEMRASAMEKYRESVEGNDAPSAGVWARILKERMDWEAKMGAWEQFAGGEAWDPANPYIAEELKKLDAEQWDWLLHGPPEKTVLVKDGIIARANRAKGK